MLMERGAQLVEGSEQRRGASRPTGAQRPDRCYEVSEQPCASMVIANVSGVSAPRGKARRPDHQLGVYSVTRGNGR